MTLHRNSGIQFLVAVILILNCVHTEGRAADWLTKLEQRRIRIQSDIDLLIKFFCSYDQRDVNCQVRLPQLREELRQIDEQLLNYRNEETPKTTYQQFLPNRGLADLIRNRRFLLAEQDLLGHMSDVSSVVQEVYDNRVDNFNKLVDFATAIHNADLKFLVYKHSLEEIIRRGHDEPLHIVRIIRGLQDEVVENNSVNDETHNLATTMIDNLKILFETGVSKVWIDKIISHSFEQDSSVPIVADEISSLDPELFSSIISKVIIAVYPLTDKHLLMRNMEKFHLLPQLIDGFTVIYNEMTKANDVNGKPYILKLGYYCRELLARSNVTLLHTETRSKLHRLEEKLPLSIHSLIFKDRVCLKNKFSRDNIHIAHGHPRLQRYAVMAAGNQLRWIPRPLNYTTCFEFPYGGYLFADDRNPDGRSRLVSASFDSKDILLGSEWEIEPVGNDCLIRNVAYNELLYVGDEIDRERLSEKVFTMPFNTVSARSDDRFKWTILGC